MGNEKYVNTPLATTLYEALKARAKANGRNLGRELGEIAKRALVGRRPTISTGATGKEA